MTFKFVCFALILIFSTTLACANPLDTSIIPEARAVWLNADALPVSKSEASILMEKYAKAHINIIFPEVICRGYSVYISRFIGRDPRFVGKPDPLALLIPEAHKRGIEVHPWVWVFRAGYTKDRGWILNNHPDWLELDKYGDDLSANGGLWISPAVPEARQFLIDVFSELVRKYQVDGLHLDYIRYESQSPTPYGYNKVSQESFSKIYNKNASQLSRLSPDWIDWQLYREELVNTFVHAVSLRVRYLKPDLKLSVAVAPDITFARMTLLQNWRHWVNNRWVDFITPMAYFSDNDKLRNAAKLTLSTVDNKIPVAIGLGLHLMKPKPQTVAEQIDISRVEGCLGQALFASSYITPEILDILAAGTYSKQSHLPFRNIQDQVLGLTTAAVLSQDQSLIASAQRYSRYVEYQSQDLDFIWPMAPPVNIPANVIPTPMMHCRRTAQPIIIDGKLDEDCWKNAPQQNIAYTSDGDAYTSSISVMTAWDQSNLYVAFVVQDNQGITLTATVTSRDGPVFYDDSVEVFIDPENNRRSYFHLSANSAAIQFDQRVNKAMNAAWNGEWTCAANVNANTWTTEFAIPFSTLGIQAPVPGTSWAINFTRNIPTKPKPTYLNWSVVYGSYHSPDRFGTIVFD